MTGSWLPPVGVAASTLVLATLAACDSVSSAEPIAAPSTGSSAASSRPSSTPSATTSSSSLDREVPLPDDVDVLVDWEPTGDEVTDAVVQSVVNARRAAWAVMASGDFDVVPYQNYVAGQGERAIFDEFISAYIEAGIGITGTEQLHDFQVTDVTETSATVTFCADQSGQHIIERETREIIPALGVPALWRETGVVTMTDNRWKVSAVASEGGVGECAIDA